MKIETSSMSDALDRALCGAIEGFFGGGRCFLLAKGRVALYVGLRALGLPPGSTVLMPGYTCVVVPSAVQYAGLKPAYVDIDPHTYNMASALLEKLPASNVSAIIIQHTYGIPAAVAAIQQRAASRGIPVIEDCCHTFGTRIDGRLSGTFGAFAFMSGQWTKPFSTGLGGMLLVNDAQLAGRVEEIVRQEGSSPGPLKNMLLQAQILAFQLLVRPSTAARMTAGYRALNRWGLAIGSSTEGELKGQRPPGYLTTMAPCQVRRGLREMSRIGENIRHRTHLVAFYHRELPRIGFAALSCISAEGMPLLRYPVRVANKAEVLTLAAKKGLEIGSWFEVPLHPAGTHMEDFGYCPGMCPQGEAASGQVINLPTHLRVSEKVAERTLRFLSRYGEPGNGGAR